MCTNPMVRTLTQHQITEGIMAEINPVELQKALKGASYPTDREHLTELAKKNHADRQVVDTIAHLREKEFDGPDKVETAVFRGKGR